MMCTLLSDLIMYKSYCDTRGKPVFALVMSLNLKTTKNWPFKTIHAKANKKPTILNNAL